MPALSIEALAAGVGTLLLRLAEPAARRVPPFAIAALGTGIGEQGLGYALMQATALHEIRAVCAAAEAVLRGCERTRDVEYADDAARWLRAIADPVGSSATQRGLLEAMLDRYGRPMEVAREVDECSRA